MEANPDWRPSKREWERKWRQCFQKSFIYGKERECGGSCLFKIEEMIACLGGRGLPWWLNW